MMENESSFMAPTPHPDARPFEAYTVFARFELWLETQLNRVPVSLPASWPENIAHTAPWVSLAFLPLQALTTLALLGFSALGALMGCFAFLSLVLGLVILVCVDAALPCMYENTRTD